MDKRTQSRLFKRAIMNMNAIRQMDERERRFDRAYGILLATLLLVPMLVSPALFAFEHYLLGGGFLAVCWLAFLSIGLWRRHAIIRAYYQVNDVENYIRVVREGTGPLPAQLDDILMLYPFQTTHDELAFMYNWLYRTKLLGPDGRITIYQVGGRTLAARAGIELPNADLLCVPMRSLDLNKDNAERFSLEYAVVGGRLVDCRLVKDEEQLGVLANKGQRLN